MSDNIKPEDFNIDKAINNLKFAKSLKISVYKDKNGDFISITDHSTDMLITAEEYGEVNAMIERFDTFVPLYKSPNSEESTKYYHLIRETVADIV